MSEEKKIIELNEENLEKVAGGFNTADENTRPIGTEDEADRAILENLTDNKGADE